MLPRLKQRREFLACARADRRQTKTVGVQVRRHTPAERDRLTALRIGFTASKKVGNAVVRNRAKRRLRAAAEQVLSHASAPGFDVVLIARTVTATCPFAELQRDLRWACRKLGLLS